MLHLDRLYALPGQCLAVTGPSGCGKSTLLGLLSLALQPGPGGGHMRVGGTDALTLWRTRRDAELTRLRARLMGFIPQTAALLPYLTVRQNIVLPQAVSGRHDPAFAERIATQLGVGHVLDRIPAEVSVGQRQRAAIARAVSHRPALVLADEPTAAVHPGQATEIMALLAALAHEAGSTLVIATHDPDRAERAGFTVAPCVMHGTGATRFGWGG